MHAFAPTQVHGDGLPALADRVDGPPFTVYLNPVTAQVGLAKLGGIGRCTWDSDLTSDEHAMNDTPAA